ncbi:uncharacterized protein LOC142330099 [Lycorma delicatula]|uniref:uncharacterized protein LOC142330099 n=1 Tax=Lycorma delicatula TaxID=130591 RepID=UPI003F51741D
MSSEVTVKEETKIKRLKEENEYLINENRLPADENKISSLVIYKKKFKEGDKNQQYEYYAIRRQKRSLNPAIKKLLKNYPGSEEIFRKHKDKGGVSLYNVMKENTAIFKWNKYAPNNFTTPLTTEQLVGVLNNFCKNPDYKILGSLENGKRLRQTQITEHLVKTEMKESPGMDSKLSKLTLT